MALSHARSEASRLHASFGESSPANFLYVRSVKLLRVKLIAGFGPIAVAAQRFGVRMAKRHWQQMAEDKVLAHGNYGWGDMWERGPLSKRAKAIQKVCGELPNDLYARLKERMQDRVWFIPTLELGGTTKNLPASKIIYLSPIWEAASDKLVEYIVLHELLHVILDHRLSLDANVEAEKRINDEQETQVDEKVVELGHQNLRAEATDFIGCVKDKLGELCRPPEYEG